MYFSLNTALQVCRDASVHLRCRAHERRVCAGLRVLQGKGLHLVHTGKAGAWRAWRRRALAHTASTLTQGTPQAGLTLSSGLGKYSDIYFLTLRSCGGGDATQPKPVRYALERASSRALTCAVRRRSCARASRHGSMRTASSHSTCSKQTCCGCLPRSSAEELRASELLRVCIHTRDAYMVWCACAKNVCIISRARSSPPAWRRPSAVQEQLSSAAAKHAARHVPLPATQPR